MSDYRITRTRKDGPDLDHRIDAVEFSGSLYWVDQVTAWIEAGTHRFYTHVNGISAWVYVVRRGGNSKPFITTSSDGYGPNNLLSLPDC